MVRDTTLIQKTQRFLFFRYGKLLRYPSHYNGGTRPLLLENVREAAHRTIRYTLLAGHHTSGCPVTSSLSKSGYMYSSRSSLVAICSNCIATILHCQVYFAPKKENSYIKINNNCKSCYQNRCAFSAMPAAFLTLIAFRHSAGNSFLYRRSAKRSSISKTSPRSCSVRMTRPAACRTLFMPG